MRYTRPVQKVSSLVIWKIETFTEEDRRYRKHCTQDNDTSIPFKAAPWDLTQFSQLPSAAPLYFPESYWCSEISSILKVILVLGKARSHRAPNLGCRVELSHLGALMFCQKPLHEIVPNEWAQCHDEAANHQLPMAAAFWITRIVSVEKIVQA